MSTLTEFLLARIAEDEVKIHGDWSEGRGMHIITEEMHGRMLAECAAKRRIIELRYSWNLQAEQMTEPPFGPIFQVQVNTADAILRTLAMPYAEHPDYDEAWRPCHAARPGLLTGGPPRGATLAPALRHARNQNAPTA